MPSLQFFANNGTKNFTMNVVNRFSDINGRCSFKHFRIFNSHARIFEGNLNKTENDLNTRARDTKQSVVQFKYKEILKDCVNWDKNISHNIQSEMERMTLRSSTRNAVANQTPKSPVVVNEENFYLRHKPKKKRKSYSHFLAGINESNVTSVQSQSLLTLERLFPKPVSTLSEMYENAFREHNNTKLNLSTVYEQVDNCWMCTYDLKWPEKKIKYIGPSKEEAAHYGALSVLNYLSRCSKITITKAELIVGKKILNKSSNMVTQTRNMCTSTQLCTRSRQKVEEVSSTEENDSFEEIDKLFPNPKNVLHNCFDVLAKDLKRDDLKISPSYKYSKGLRTWTCTYQLKWPESVKFSKTGFKKTDVSNKTALSALNWLKKNNKINLLGKAILHDNEEIKNIKSSSKPVLSLDADVENKLKHLRELYENEMKHLIGDFNGGGVNVDNLREIEKLWPDRGKRPRQKCRGLDVYYTRESVKLPISDFKEEIIRMVDDNQVVIIKGEPGCGKSTRVPQYVLEGWANKAEFDDQPCKIIVTQPRRIAAISLAERVSTERNEQMGNTVGYQVRLKSNFNNYTGRILYCTTGILLRRLQSDPTLSDCSHILLDEAHERDVNTDLLMNILKRALRTNPNMRLVVMSATIDTNMFQEYFDQAPIIHIPGFTYPVRTHFLDETKKLDLSRTARMCESGEPTVVAPDVATVIQFIHKNRGEGAILCFLPGWDDIAKVRNLLQFTRDMTVVCLHSRLRDSDQGKVFSRPPPGTRKVILSTNIAETSVTIDDVVYVIDTGVHKEERLDIEKGIMCVDNHWISQSSMAQRKGRAGRVQPGESFHLYPKHKYNQFEQFSLPEILRTSLTKIVLDSKVYSGNMKAVEFLSQLPSPPDSGATIKAVEELKELELLDEDENLTPLGRTLSEFQLEPKLAKAMVIAVIFKCVTPIIDIVTLFSAETDIFASSILNKESIKKFKSEFSTVSDHLSLMRMFEEWLESAEHGDLSRAEQFCFDYNLVDHKLSMLLKLRRIHFEYLHKGLHSVSPISDDYSDNDELVKGVLLSGVGTVLQRRNWDFNKGRLKGTNVLLTRHNQKATIASESVNYKRAKFPSDFLLYINETMSKVRRTTVVRETSLISPLTVLLFKNNNISIKDIPKFNYSDNVKSSDQVLITLDGTKIEFVCDRKQAELIKSCKSALQAGLQYYIFHLTHSTDSNEAVNRHWKGILDNINSILNIVKL